MFTRIYSAPVNYKNADGKWRAIDTRVSAGADGRYHSGAGPVAFSLGRQTGGSTLVTAGAKDWTVGFGLDGAARSSGKTKDNEVTYTNVAPNLDLTYAVGATSLKETAVLKRRPATGDDLRLSFPLTLHGAAPKAEAGGITFYGPEGERVGRIPPGKMWDRAGAEHAVGMTLDSKSSLPKVEINAEGSWLSSPNRRYPVFIDPTVTFSPSGDTWVSSSSPTTNFGGDVTGSVGVNGLGGTTRTLTKFDLSSLAGKNIVQANFTGYVFSSTTWPAATVMSLHRLTSTWSASTVTWNTKPTYSGADSAGDWNSSGMYTRYDLTGWVRN